MFNKKVIDKVSYVMNQMRNTRNKLYKGRDIFIISMGWSAWNNKMEVHLDFESWVSLGCFEQPYKIVYHGTNDNNTSQQDMTCNMSFVYQDVVFFALAEVHQLRDYVPYERLERLWQDEQVKREQGAER